MSLARAEARRLVKRRFTKFFVAGLLILLVAIAAGMFLTNEKIGSDQRAAAQAEAQAQFQRSYQQSVTEKENCTAAQGTPAASQFPPNCDDIYIPTESDYDPQWFMPATFEFLGEFPGMITTLAALLAMVAFVVGASFVGAEWNSGGMMNLLLWRPTRIRVLATKLTILLAGAAVLTVVVSALWTAAFLAIADLRGSTDGLTSGAWQSIALTELRGLALVLVAGAAGFSLASLGRHTAMALGVAVGVVIVLQFGLGAVLFMAKVKFAEAYLAPVWMSAWMDKTYRIEDTSACDFSSNNGCQPAILDLTWQHAGGLLAGILVVTVGAALWAIRRRDIT
ncbi:ABC transporter permease subunit [Actinoplanes sp. LDG1-06]|uniref:ABC transporter permease subunit n=1 Tax=Paractinoplanes ovalisporus TaxID=2810368 RepID=A0ABS2ABT2_9ACTN|nr:ABC transporter permease subunit [Actinoplanes ovalisporus]MBM2617289.1 ABC transporter permease subunit [Actinoplanes ovalisporus]